MCAAVAAPDADLYLGREKNPVFDRPTVIAGWPIHAVRRALERAKKS